MRVIRPTARAVFYFLLLIFVLIAANATMIATAPLVMRRIVSPAVASASLPVRLLTIATTNATRAARVSCIHDVAFDFGDRFPMEDDAPLETSPSIDARS